MCVCVCVGNDWPAGRQPARPPPQLCVPISSLWWPSRPFPSLHAFRRSSSSSRNNRRKRSSRCLVVVFVSGHSQQYYFYFRILDLSGLVWCFSRHVANGLTTAI